jgi:hypothetical protein
MSLPACNTQPKPLQAQEIAMIRFQRYLTSNYPITSAMSYVIGQYVLTHIVNLKK